jgi:ABC-2 type transport system ATP-binding protein
MAQKVQFIVAVIARPKLLILDEPFAGLDPVNMDLLKEAVLSLRELGTTVVFSTHDMNVAATMCDMVLMIFRGRKVLDGSLAEIQQNYPVNSLRLRLADGADLPTDLPGIASASRSAGFHIVRLPAGSEPQAILQQIAACRVIEHFEVIRPSLHDIFVDIARPQERERVSV